MDSKSLIRDRIWRAQAATEMSPADFPLGSLQSRVAMRALLDEMERRRAELPSYDQDALLLYHTVMLAGSISPSWLDLEATQVWRHGKELAASGEHEGDSLPLPEVLEKAGITLREYFQFRFERYRQAWLRRLPELPFPIRIEKGDRVYFRQHKGDWEEQTGPILDDILGTFSPEDLALLQGVD